MKTVIFSGPFLKYELNYWTQHNRSYKFSVAKLLNLFHMLYTVWFVLFEIRNIDKMIKTYPV